MKNNRSRDSRGRCADLLICASVVFMTSAISRRLILPHSFIHSVQTRSLYKLARNPSILARTRMMTTLSAGPGSKRELQATDEGSIEKRPRLDAPESETAISKPPQAVTSTASREHPQQGATKTTNKQPPRMTKRQKKKRLNIEPCSHDDVYWREVIGLIGQETVDSIAEAGQELESPFEFREEVDLEISQLSSNGMSVGLSHASPFCLRPMTHIQVRVLL